MQNTPLLQDETNSAAHDRSAQATNAAQRDEAGKNQPNLPKYKLSPGRHKPPASTRRSPEKRTRAEKQGSPDQRRGSPRNHRPPEKRRSPERRREADRADPPKPLHTHHHHRRRDAGRQTGEWHSEVRGGAHQPENSDTRRMWEKHYSKTRKNYEEKRSAILSCFEEERAHIQSLENDLKALTDLREMLTHDLALYDKDDVALCDQEIDRTREMLGARQQSLETREALFEDVVVQTLRVLELRQRNLLKFDAEKNVFKRSPHLAQGFYERQRELDSALEKFMDSYVVQAKSKLASSAASGAKRAFS